MIPESEPTLITDPELSEILTDLMSYEPIFHRPEKGTTRADFERMTVSDFWEVGASGARYSRAHVLDVLERRSSAPQDELPQATGFHCRKLAHDLYLLTYNLVQNQVRHTRRTTIWQHTTDGWKIVFHQGTIIQEQKL